MFLRIRCAATARLSRPRRAPTRYHPMEQSEHDALTAPRKEWATGPPSIGSGHVLTPQAATT